jgi:hypothetical protein
VAKQRVDVRTELRQLASDEEPFLSRAITGDLAPCDFFLFPKKTVKLKGRRFDTTEDIQAESQKVLDTLTEKDFQEAFQKWRRRWDWCLHVGRNYFEGMAADRPYGEFYDFYSVSPEYFEYTLILQLFYSAV